MKLRHLWHLLYVIPTLVGMWQLDQWISRDRTDGLRRAYITSVTRRLAEKPDARIALLGQSTMQWLSGRTLSGMLGVAESDVVDAHIGGCHPGCTFAEIRKLLGEGRHFEQVYFGINLYELCEDPRSWRVQTQLALMPGDELLDLQRLYLHAEHPLTYYGRTVGMWLSGAYADSDAARKRVRKALGFGQAKDASQQNRWARRDAKVAEWLPTCDYDPDGIALKTAFIREVLADLPRLSDRVFYVLLPDRTRGMPEHDKVWETHMAAQRALVQAAPGVELIDLVSDGARAWGHFRDGVHLSGAGLPIQTALMRRRLHDLGLLRKPGRGAR